MAKIETTFIRPKELYTPETGETKVVYDGYQNNPHELVVEENLEGEVSEIVNDTFVPNEGGNVVFTDGNDVAHELITKSGLGKAQVIETTWQELKDKRDNGQLIAGSLYRITDYNCTTIQENTRSAGHQFDIVLLALSENKLAEEGWAMMNESNVYDVTFVDGVTKKCWIYRTGDTNDGSLVNVVDIDTKLGINDLAVDEITINETNKTATITNVAGYESIDLTEENLTYNYFQNSNLSAWKVWYCLDNDKSRFAWADDSVDEGTGLPNGRGVIYRLIDEFNNDIKYDFKNIQFKRKLTDGQYDANGTETWCYTLNVWYNDMCQDASIVGNTMPNDEGYVTGVYDNIFGYATAFDFSLEGVNTFAFALGNNVVLSFDDDGYYGIRSNTIGNDFNGNTIGNDFYGNTIGNDFIFNTIGNSFDYNTIGNSFKHKNISTRLTYANYGNNGVELATKNDIGNIETALSNI